MQPNRLIARDRQGAITVISAPTTEATRAHLLEVVRQKPVIVPAARPEPTLLDMIAWKRRSRAIRAQALLRTFPAGYATPIAEALGVTGRTLTNWRGAHHAPTPRHAKQLWALAALLYLYSKRT